MRTFACLLLLQAAAAEDGVFVRFKLVEPKEGKYFVRLGGYIHRDPWYLPAGVVPEGAAGEFTPWFDLKKHAGPKLHGRLNRAGGVAEFPNVTATFSCEPKAERLEVVIELATAADEGRVVKRWRESFTGALTSFLVSPTLVRDADALETAAEMTERRLRWAREATGGKRRSPERLIVQTSFWSPQRPELNVKEAEVLRLLGFNVVGNQPAEVRERNLFKVPGHTHDVQFGPAATREAVDALMKKRADRTADGVPFNFSDEIAARPPIGDDPQALAHFRAWLAERKLEDMRPIETPEQLREREKSDGPAARRAFYYTSRFRQQAATERVRWHTEAYHRLHGPGALTSTLLADHPYFAGSGLGMGMTPNPAWGGYPLACDWFDIARRRAVDLVGIEDWMGLQYMYGPGYTWEGFQLMGFQAAMIRSGGRGLTPSIAWITPSDKTNLLLKTASALCQGAKHFFYWTYGPTATSTENYWSDLRGAYDGVAAVTRHLAAAEHLIAPGRMRPTRVALLYAISSDLWQPFGYVPMLERRALYLSLVHDQYLVDLLTEEDVLDGRLADYDVLYTADPCIADAAARRIVDWVRDGGWLTGTTAAGSRNEFNEPASHLAEAFGIKPGATAAAQPGRYHVRGALNGIAYTDRIRFDAAELGVIGVKASLEPTTGKVTGRFGDGRPAAVENAFGKGRAYCIGACPGVTYVKEAKFVAAELKEKWPEAVRRLINGAARTRGVARPVELSHAVVEAGVYDAPGGSVLALANFTYVPIDRLEVRLPVRRAPSTVRSVERGPLTFTTDGSVVIFTLPLALTDVVLVE